MKWFVALTVAAACGDNLAPPEMQLPPDAPPPWAEAAHGTPPTLVDLGGGVLTAPKIQPIFFANDAAMQAKIEQFSAMLGGSDYWHIATSEYGVGEIGALPTIVTTDTPPATEDALATWLAGKLDGTHAAQGWPATVDAQTIYSVFTPDGVVVGDACKS